MDSEEEGGGNESRRHLSFHIGQPEKSPGGGQLLPAWGRRNG